MLLEITMTTLSSRMLAAATARAVPAFRPALARQLSLPGQKVERVRSRVADVATAAVLLGVGGTGLWLGYSSRRHKRDRLAGCQELGQDKYVRASLPLVRHRGAVLPRDMVASGTAEEVGRFELRDEDVVVASFPKSGTTWLQEVAWRLGHLRGPPDPQHPPGTVLETRFPYLEFAYPGLRDVAGRPPGRRYLKTHLPRHLLPESLGRRPGCRVLYIYRDPRDVAVSYYHFSRLLTYIDYYGSLERFIKRLFMGDMRE